MRDNRGEHNAFTTYVAVGESNHRDGRGNNFCAIPWLLWAPTPIRVRCENSGYRCGFIYSI